jgi:metal-sulfur cluster biosynthetic enzyme
MTKEEQIQEVYKEISTVIDPEVGFNLVEMGLIYKVEIDDNGICDVDMTLSTPSCPLHGMLTQWTQEACLRVNGVNEAKINLVFDPPWNPTMAQDHVKARLGG